MTIKLTYYPIKILNLYSSKLSLFFSFFFWYCGCLEFFEHLTNFRMNAVIIFVHTPYNYDQYKLFVPLFEFHFMFYQLWYVVCRIFFLTSIIFIRKVKKYIYNKLWLVKYNVVQSICIHEWIPLDSFGWSDYKEDEKWGREKWRENNVCGLIWLEWL